MHIYMCIYTHIQIQVSEYIRLQYVYVHVYVQLLVYKNTVYTFVCGRSHLQHRGTSTVFFRVFGLASDYKMAVNQSLLPTVPEMMRPHGISRGEVRCLRSMSRPSMNVDDR